jgi:hypothetical protein
MIAALANASWLAASLPEHARYRRALHAVRAAQEARLHALIRANTATAFGRAHGFARIRSMADYRAAVPVATYEDLRPWIERAAEGEARVLTASPVRRFEPTSGTTAGTKWIPCTDASRREFARGVAAWIADLFRQRPALMHGAAYWGISPAVPETVTRGGLPVGFADDADYAGGLRRHLVDRVLAVPSSVRRLGDMDAFWLATLTHLVRRTDLRLISVWSPTFLRILCDRLVADADRVARALDRAAARRLEAALAAPTAADRHARLWPRLTLVSCWADGQSAAGAREITARFPHAEVQGKGLLATEGFVSLPLVGHEGGVLAVRSHLLEFLPAGDAAAPAVGAAELDIGGRYSVVLSTGAGLYRYHLGDVVEVLGRVGECPRVRFVGRGLHVSDWRGEKLDDAHVTAVVAGATAGAARRPAFAMLAYEPSLDPVAYVLYVDAADDPARLAADVDAGLCANVHYRYARALGQLGPVRACVAADAEAAWLAAAAARGGPIGTLKAPALDPRGGWLAAFRGRGVEPVRIEPALSASPDLA